MKKTILISTVFALILSVQAQAQLPWWIDEVEVLPPNPTSSDVVHITLSGLWGDSCIPNDSNTVITANDVYFDVIRDYPWPVYCFAVVMGWARAEAIGPLPAGTYTVHACLMECDSSLSLPPFPCVLVEPYTPVAEFTVTATTYYVDAVDGNDSNDGLTPETAFATIQKGINTAQSGDTLMVLPGTYNENINFLGKNITLTSSDPSNPSMVNQTIIRGDGSTSVVTFTGNEDANCSLCGFTITGGGGRIGGGIYGNGTLASIKHNVIRLNLCSYFDFPGMVLGGGLYDCDGTIRYNIIAENVIMSYDSEVTLAGGGLCGCDGTIEYNIISNNLVQGTDYHIDASGAGLANCDAVIRCNIISENKNLGSTAPNCGAGGGLAGCDGSIENNTIFANRALYGGGIYSCGGPIRNCIIWANLDNQIGGTVPNLSYSDIQGGWPGVGNIDADPCFADPGNGDYHLKSQVGRWDPEQNQWVADSNTSLCIDAGNPGCPTGDEPAPNGNRRNMGAYGGTAEASKSPVNWALLADLTNDRIVDCGDLGVFADYWLEAGECIPADLSRDHFADGVDYALFALQWLNTTSSEPGMTYQIGECDFGAIDANSEEPRFSVRVEGNYIHFEDMMVANCCPEELGLEMVLEGNVITVFEIEYTPGGCWCICDYPIDATLGPFEPGTYTLEVYEDFGGFIGSTTITIGSG